MSSEWLPTEQSTRSLSRGLRFGVIIPSKQDVSTHKLLNDYNYYIILKIPLMLHFLLPWATEKQLLQHM